jgi:hypothetical protein
LKFKSLLLVARCVDTHEITGKFWIETLSVEVLEENDGEDAEWRKGKIIEFEKLCAISTG